jgi:sigma-B regulation protein RsbU (phosphoserine phosphatase)
MRDQAGHLTHWVAVCRDVTEREAREAQCLEMDLASRLQRGLYPGSAPALPGYELAGAVFSAEATCGDYFDFVPLADGRMVIAIGDVSGHGLGPALVMTQVRAYLRAWIDVIGDLGEILERINRALLADLGGDAFVSLLLLVLDPGTGELEYANAGHVPAQVIDSSGRVRTRMAPTGPALGLIEGARYGVSDGTRLGAAELVLLMTDGVTETRDRDGECLWEEGAAAIAGRQRHESAASILEHLYEGTRIHAKGRVQDDDVTLVVLKASALVSLAQDMTGPVSAPKAVSVRVEERSDAIVCRAT